MELCPREEAELLEEQQELMQGPGVLPWAGAPGGGRWGGAFTFSRPLLTALMLKAAGHGLRT